MLYKVLSYEINELHPALGCLKVPLPLFNSLLVLPIGGVCIADNSTGRVAIHESLQDSR